MFAGIAYKIMNKKKLLQLNVTANWGSTGKIAEGIGLAAMARGWEITIAYGRMMNPSQSQLIKVGSKIDPYLHYARHRLLDQEGLGSKGATKKFIKEIDSLEPDIIHLHNIHDHWLNYPLLFDYFASIDTPIVWTFHDCWAFTGGCAHFVEWNCNQWITKCEKCPFQKRKIRGERSNHKKHIKYFTQLQERLHIISVSSWLDGLVANSRLRDIPHSYIYNGVDCDVFTPRDPTSLLVRYNLIGKKILLGVSSVWPKSKGIDDYIELSKLLDDSYRIVLIGVPVNLHKNLPSNIIPIERTQNIDVLAEWYSAAIAVLSLSKAETFGMTLAEGLACGTPSIGYNSTAIKEIISSSTGLGVPVGNIMELKKAIQYLCSHIEEYQLSSCRNRALTNYNRNLQFGKYVDLYESIIEK